MIYGCMCFFLMQVTWVEHVEADNRGVHNLYQSLVSSGIGFGAMRWLCTLQRQCERIASVLANIPAADNMSGMYGFSVHNISIRFYIQLIYIINNLSQFYLHCVLFFFFFGFENGNNGACIHTYMQCSWAGAEPRGEEKHAEACGADDQQLLWGCERVYGPYMGDSGGEWRGG